MKPGLETAFRRLEFVFDELIGHSLSAGSFTRKRMACTGGRCTRFIDTRELLRAVGEGASNVFIPWQGAGLISLPAEVVTVRLFRPVEGPDMHAVFYQVLDRSPLKVQAVLARLLKPFCGRLTVWLAGDALLTRLLANACRSSGINVRWLEETSIANPAQDSVAALIGSPSGDPPVLGAVATHKSAPTMLEVPRLLGFERAWFQPGAAEAGQADAFYSWGIRSSIYRARLRWLAEQYERPWFVAEDGLLLRSVPIGVGETAAHTLSVTLDSNTAYYDATRPSLLEQRLNSSFEISPEQRSRAQSAMKELRLRRLSKYNHAPDTHARFGPQDARRVLLVDQRRYDASVRFGEASERSFDAMIRYVIKSRPDSHLLLKRHPDAISGGLGSYFSDRRLKRLPIPWHRTTLIDEDVNPHTLFDQVDEVFVVTSGFGFEALMAGVPVHCFGSPFYAGWGLTTDYRVISRRERPRDLPTLFHLACVELARYFSPDLGRQITLEDAIDNFTLMTAAGK